MEVPHQDVVASEIGPRPGIWDRYQVPNGLFGKARPSGHTT
jgi:hypothetical protein